LVVLFVAACASERHWTLEENRAHIAEGDEEQRYFATLNLSRFGEAALPDLEHLLTSPEPMTRNAAARTLCDLGVPRAARALIDNLHPDRRTFVATDAVYHLRAVFGTGLGYDPNLGYRHQAEKQDEWWTWWATQPFGEAVVRDDPDADRRALRRAAWHDRIQTFQATRFETPEQERAAIRELWKALAGRRSRHPDDVADEEHAFALFVDRWPENPDLWNNYALAALNNGDYDTARSAYQLALDLRPGDASLYNDFGILLEGLGRLTEAEAHYRKACRFDPKSDVAAANLADVLRERGFPDKAIKWYRVAERLAPDKWPYHRLWLRRLERRRR
jgi:tetratricopeptide (TPR) repeat protein